MSAQNACVFFCYEPSIDGIGEHTDTIHLPAIAKIDVLELCEHRSAEDARTYVDSLIDQYVAILPGRWAIRAGTAYDYQRELPDLETALRELKYINIQ